MNIVEKQIPEIVEFLKKDKNISAIYLFGSYATGKYNSNSDLDIAVIYNTKKEIMEHMGISIDLEKMVGGTKVDYVDINEANLYFKVEILRTGKRLYVKNEEIHRQYLLEIQRQYNDMYISRNRYMNYVINDVKKERD